MKKLSCLVAVAAMGLVTAVQADEVNLRIGADASAMATVTVNAGEMVSVHIQAEVTADGGGAATLQGLALVGTNVVKGGDLAGDVDLDPNAGELALLPGSLMANFDRNLGLTNPPGPEATFTGYSGTLDGSGNLLQVGGGQNTIGNTDPPVYPVGPVDTGIGNSGYVDVALGDLTTPMTAGTITLTLNAAFANVLADSGPAPFAVEAASSVNLTNATLTINVQAGLPDCENHDVNCDGSTNSTDIGVIRAIANFNKAVCDANPAARPLEPRADVNRDGSVNSTDIGVVRALANFNTSTGTCTCTQHPDLPCP